MGRHVAAAVLVAALAAGCAGAAAHDEPHEQEQTMVVTMLEARVAEEREAELRQAYEAGTVGTLPPAIMETFLLRADDGVWRIVTVWRSRAELEAYRASVETPGGVLMFRAAGAEPMLSIFEVAARAP